MAIILMVTPGLVYYLMRKYKARLEEEVILQKVGSLYENIEIQRKYSIAYITLYFLRRLIFSLSIAFIGSSSFLQVSISMVFSLSILCIQVDKRRFKTKIIAFFEFYNELTILLVLTCLLPIAVDYFSADTV